MTSTFSAEQCVVLEDLFSGESPGEWQERDGAFYQCSLKDVTQDLPPMLAAQVLRNMREITGLPLVDRVEVTAQKMIPGQAIGRHSDRPLLGYEIARLVVQLNQDWQADHGGVLQLFATQEGEVVHRINPEYNQAFGFLLHADSYHSVTEVTCLRRSVVFNFWHVANSRELAEHVQTLFADMHFSALPDALNPVASTAEMRLSEDVTLLASTAAFVLHRWGYDAVTIVAGYQHTAGILICDDSDTQNHAAVLLAEWLALLYRDSFDLSRWQILREKLAGREVVTRLHTAWQLCLPEPGERAVFTEGRL